MKNLLFLLSTIIVFGVSCGSGEGLQFESEDTTWASILEKAQQEEKLIFLVAYSKTCHNCQFMQDSIYPDHAVGAAFNNKYINVKMDVENGEGIELSMQYQVIAYPTYMILDTKGNLLHKSMGTRTAKELAEFGRTGSKPDYQYTYLKEQFEAGDRDPQRLKNLCKIAMNLEDTYLMDAVHSKYLATQRNWLTSENMEILMKGLRTIEQQTFEYLLEHKAAFIDQLGEAAVYNKIEELILNNISLHAYDPSIEGFNLEKGRAYGAQHLPENLLNQAMDLFTVNQYLSQGAYPEYQQATVKYFETYPCYNAVLLNNMALSFYEQTEDPELLEHALSWALRAVDQKDIYRFNDTVAALYFKLSQTEQAKTYALKALKQAEKTGEHADATQALLEKMNKL